MACSSNGALDRRMNQFQKILRMDDMVDAIVNGCNKTMDFSHIGHVEHKDFDEVVDLNHVHQSLEGMTNIVEQKFAFAVLQNLEQLETIKEIVYEQGKKIVYTKVPYLDRIYSYLDLNLLDGMPCDETKKIIKMEENELSWQVMEDKHESFWNGNVTIYYSLMEEYIKGILSQTSIHIHISPDKVFTLAQ